MKILTIEGIDIKYYDDPFELENLANLTYNRDMFMQPIIAAYDDGQPVYYVNGIAFSKITSWAIHVLHPYPRSHRPTNDNFVKQVLERLTKDLI